MKKYVLHYVKLITPLSFQTRFSKRQPAYNGQVVNPLRQTPQAQSVAKPGGIYWLIDCWTD